MRQRDLLGGGAEDVTPRGAAGAADQPGTPQGHQQLVEEGTGDVLARGDVMAGDGPVGAVLGEVEKRADPVIRLHADSQGWIVDLLCHQSYGLARLGVN